MRCVAFKPLERGSLQGFADLMSDGGLILLGCTYHRLNGKAWCSPPSRPQLDRERQLVLGGDGKIVYAPVIEFADARTRRRWSDEAVEAIQAFRRPESKAPAIEAGAMSVDAEDTRLSNRGAHYG
jgi:hypothetical protein